MLHAPHRRALFDPRRRKMVLSLAAGASAAFLPAAFARQAGAGWSMQALHGFVSSEGSRAVGSPVFASDGALYGVHAMGGERGLGSVYRWAADGNFEVLRHFDYADAGPAEPESGLVLGSDGLLWGTSFFGGEKFMGTLYTVSLDGTVTVRAEFSADIGMTMPRGALVEGRRGRFYGTTGGCVFRFDARAGGGLKQLFRFSAETGAGCQAALVLGPDGKLYGCNHDSGAHGHGTLFRIATDGSAFEVLKALGRRWEGRDLRAPLLLAGDGFFYGCATAGGVFDRGVVFRLGVDGAYEIVHHFAGGSNDGAYPDGGLVEGVDGALYGTTLEGGAAPQSFGTVFRLNRRGGLSLIHRFNENGDNGSTPAGALCFGPDGLLYGTNQSGGRGRTGVLYRLGRPA
jgi:uncharacterized repeat protein (TIGR03803 family)